MGEKGGRMIMMKIIEKTQDLGAKLYQAGSACGFGVINSYRSY